ncbi:MAG TPA: hypothetical protein VIO94_05205 [Phenylobacterium sp.]
MIEVPWSVAWSGEQAFRIQPSRDFPGRLELDQREARGVGEAQFAALHVTRQRRAMADFLCHVCGRPTEPRDRFIFPAASGGLVDLEDGSKLYGCNVPPMHRACSVRARHACPHLGKVDEPPLRLGSDQGWLIPRTDITPGLEAIADKLPAGREVVLSCYRLYGEAFTRKVIAARAAWEDEVRSRRSRRRDPAEG